MSDIPKPIIGLGGTPMFIEAKKPMDGIMRVCLEQRMFRSPEIWQSIKHQPIKDAKAKLVKWWNDNAQRLFDESEKEDD